MTLAQLLTEIEWGGKASPTHHQCPSCGALKMMGGHETDCELADVLRAACALDAALKGRPFVPRIAETP